MSVILSTVRARCPHCDYTVSQIDASKQHAIDVVTVAMERHLMDRHGL
jgi:hypothetical protein